MRLVFYRNKKIFFRFIFLKIGLDRKCWIRLILYKSVIYVFVYVFPYSASSVKRNFEYSTLTKSAVCIQMYSCTYLRLLQDVKDCKVIIRFYFRENQRKNSDEFSVEIF